MSSNYIINTELDGSFTVPAGTISSTLSLDLIGRGAPGYGFSVAENTIKALSNNGSTDSGRPLNPLKGQIWYNHTTKNLKHFVGIGVVGADQYGWGIIQSSTTLQSGLSADTASLFVRTNADSALSADNAFTVGSNGARFARIYSHVFDGVAVAAQYADVAERYAVEGLVEPGDVVCLGGVKEIYKCGIERSEEVFGVISTNPAVRMNEGAGDDTTHPFVALTGRVPVKVFGKITKGQRLVSSKIPGVARAATRAELANSLLIIGRALESSDVENVTLIEAVIGAK